LGRTLVAVVDDDALVRAATIALLRSAGYMCRGFASAEAFLAAPHDDYRCLVSDERMPGLSGVDLAWHLARHLASGRPPLPVILISAYPDAHALAARRQGVIVDVLEKPLDGEAFLACVQRVLADG
jgi:FixJ family two-component response regulator